jgi:hypothetical protein
MSNTIIGANSPGIGNRTSGKGGTGLQHELVGPITTDLSIADLSSLFEQDDGPPAAMGRADLSSGNVGDGSYAGS